MKWSLKKTVAFFREKEYYIRCIFPVPHGVMVAQLTLDQFVEVRILMRQPFSGELAERRPFARSLGPGNCLPAVSAVSSVGRAYAF